MKSTVIVLAAAFAAMATAGCAHVERTQQPSAAAGRTTVVTSPRTTTVVVQGQPWCSGAYAENSGSNFGSCSP